MVNLGLGFLLERRECLLISTTSSNAITAGLENRVNVSAYEGKKRIRTCLDGPNLVDHHLQGIEMRLWESQRKFPVHDVEEAEFEIARSFDYPTTTPLYPRNRN